MALQCYLAGKTSLEEVNRVVPAESGPAQVSLEQAAMQAYSWQGIDSLGLPQQGSIKALSKTHAKDLLTEQGVRNITLRGVTQASTHILTLAG